MESHGSGDGGDGTRGGETAAVAVGPGGGGPVEFPLLLVAEVLARGQRPLPRAQGRRVPLEFLLFFIGRRGAAAGRTGLSFALGPRARTVGFRIAGTHGLGRRVVAHDCVAAPPARNLTGLVPPEPASAEVPAKGEEGTGQSAIKGVRDLTATAGEAGINGEHGQNGDGHDASDEPGAPLVHVRIHNLLERYELARLGAAAAAVANIAVAAIGRGGGGDIRVHGFSLPGLFGKLVHLDSRGHERLAAEDDIQHKREEQNGGDDDRDDNIGRVVNEPNGKGTGKDEIGRVGGHEDGGCDVGHGELGVDPCARGLDVLGHAGHVGQEGCSRKDNGVVADKSGQAEPKHVQIEKEPSA